MGEAVYEADTASVSSHPGAYGTEEACLRASPCFEHATQLGTAGGGGPDNLGEPSLPRAYGYTGSMRKVIDSFGDKGPAPLAAAIMVQGVGGLSTVGQIVAPCVEAGRRRRHHLVE